MNLQPVLLGGLFIGVLSALPIVNVANCCCLWVIGGGVIAAYLQRQSRPGPMSMGDGAFAGFAAGACGAVVWLVASMIVDAALAPLQQQVGVEMFDSARDMPPEARAFLDWALSSAARPLLWIANFIAHLIVNMLFGALGGALATMFFRKDVPPALGGPPSPPGSGSGFGETSPPTPPGSWGGSGETSPPSPPGTWGGSGATRPMPPPPASPMRSWGPFGEPADASRSTTPSSTDSAPPSRPGSSGGFGETSPQPPRDDDGGTPPPLPPS